MKAGIVISKEEIADIHSLLSGPDDIKNIFNIKKNIKAYANLEKLDGYALTHLGSINELANKLVDELYMANEDERNDTLYDYISRIKMIKSHNISTLAYIMILHRLNKKFNKYLLN